MLLKTQAQYEAELAAAWQMLDAERRHNLELLASIEKLRLVIQSTIDNGWMYSEKLLRDALHEAEPSQALREYEAKVLEEAVKECEEWADATGVLTDRSAAMEQRFAYMNAASALRCMAERRVGLRTPCPRHR